MKTKQVAERLNKHDNTIRNYTQQYAEFLSPAPSKGEYRVYTDDDVRVLAFICTLSDSGMRHEDIRAALTRKLAEGTPFPPVIPAPSPAEMQGLITLPEMETRLAVKDAQVKEMQIRLEELRKEIIDLKERQREERSDYMEQLARVNESYMQQVSRLSEEVGRLKAELNAKSKHSNG